MKALFTTTAVLAAAAVFGSADLAAAGEGMGKVKIDRAVVETHPSQGDVREIAGSEARRIATEDGVFVSLDTRELTPGHAYTMWFVAVNAPDKCESTPCKPADVLKRSEIVQSDVGYADGLIAGADGTGQFAAFQPAGALPHAWLGTGLTDPAGAEVHLVIHDHGPLIDGREAAMIGTYRDGCTDESIPAAVPDAARADGQPGPNACRLVQDVIFGPGSMEQASN